jgi:5-methylcytosine-specific restriction endonuclease McrA
MKHDIHVWDLQPSHYANLVLLNQTYTLQEGRRFRKSRLNFLKDELARKGKLTCVYCLREDLTLGPINPASIDHIVPRSAGGQEFAHENFAVSCRGCNKKKSSMSADKFINSKYLAKKRKCKQN